MQLNVCTFEGLLMLTKAIAFQLQVFPNRIQYVYFTIKRANISLSKNLVMKLCEKNVLASVPLNQRSHNLMVKQHP